MTNRALTYLILMGLAALGAAPRGANAQEVASDTIRVYVRLAPPSPELRLAVTTPTSPQSGHVPIRYTLACDAALTASIRVCYLMGDGAAAWTTATMGLGGDGVADLATTRTGAGHEYRWNSLADIGCGTSATARIRLEAWTHCTSATPAITGAFLIANPSPPDLLAFLKGTGGPLPGGEAFLDLNHDGLIDVADLILLLQGRSINLTRASPGLEPPEPKFKGRRNK